MSKIIIGIHGLGNKPPKKILYNWWKSSIIEGLRAIGCASINVDFELLYWAHYIHPKPLDPEETNKHHPCYIEDPYLPAQGEIKRSPSRIRKKVLDTIEKPIDRLFLEGDVSVSVSSISDLIIRKYFRDLDLYYSEEKLKEWELPVKQLIGAQLVKKLRKYKRKDILLIAHSMGSIIAYDVLKEYEKKLKINTFVTIGSPLGIPMIIKKMLKEGSGTLKHPTVPECIRKYWYNLSDLRDKVSFDYSINNDYKANSRGISVIDKIVLNNYTNKREGNPHKSYGYLRTPEMAEIIYHFMLDRGKSISYIKKGLQKIRCLFNNNFDKQLKVIV